MTTPNVRELPRGSRVVPLTVEQYHRMIATGILPEGEPIELLDGILVPKDRSHQGDDPKTVSPEHVWVVKQLGKLDSLISPHGCHIRIQSPVTLPPGNEPEPDASIALGTDDLYLKRHPGASDLLCVIEASDSSLLFDRANKQSIYANAAIAQYILINLVSHEIEVRQSPIVGKGRYADLAILKQGQFLTIPLADGTQCEIAVDRLLPGT